MIEIQNLHKCSFTPSNTLRYSMIENGGGQNEIHTSLALWFYSFSNTKHENGESFLTLK